MNANCLDVFQSALGLTEFDDPALYEMMKAFNDPPNLFFQYHS